MKRLLLDYLNKLLNEIQILSFQIVLLLSHYKIPELLFQMISRIMINNVKIK
jgi:hypothetical protein